MSRDMLREIFRLQQKFDERPLLNIEVLIILLTFGFRKKS